MSKIYVVGIGPGDIEEMTPRARKAIEAADIIIGYSTYVELIHEHFKDKVFINSGMKKEVERCQMVLEKAQNGQSVALISSGDSGVYGMAGVMLEVLGRAKSNIEVEIIPGVTAASAAAALLGAPLMHDFAVISLSDCLTPWKQIELRLTMAAEGDFVVCLYNPKSKSRTEFINIAREIMLKSKKPMTPVGIVRNAGRIEEQVVITTLSDMLSHEIDMFTTVIIGNSNTYVENGRIITPRGYLL